MSTLSRKQGLAPFLVVWLFGCGQEPSKPYLPFDFVDHVDRARAELDEKRFRSFRPDGRLTSQATLGLETRQALVPPMPSALGFDVDVPVDPVLRFAIAVSTVGQPGLPVPVEFRVRVDDGSSAPGEEELVFDGVVRRREPNVWLDQEVDLTPWSGSRIRLIFETESSKAAERGANLTLLPHWGNPVLYLDSEVGRFFDGLKEMGLYDSSLIILTADHGEAFYEHGYWEHGQTLYEEMIHIPMIVKWPKDHPVGRVETLVSQIDIFPTLLEGADIPFEGEARSLRLHLEDFGNNESREVTVEVTWDPLAERGATMQIAWRGERLKYIASIAAPDVAQLYSSKIATEELYDLRADPKETRNLADELTEETDAYRRNVQRYLARARRLRAERGDTGQDVTLDESTLERLRALGYIER